MNGIEKITGRIAADAQAQAEAILSEAKAQAEAIAADAQAQAKRECVGILDQGGKDAQERADRIASMAQLEGRKRLLAARQESISAAFDRALQKLLKLPAGEYTELLAQMAARASVTGREAVILSSKDRKKAGKQVVAKANELLAKKASASGETNKDTASASGTGQLTLSQETREIPGGFILADEGVELNCAFDTLVRLARPELERQVAQILFGEG